MQVVQIILDLPVTLGVETLQVINGYTRTEVWGGVGSGGGGWHRYTQPRRGSKTLNHTGLYTNTAFLFFSRSFFSVF